MIIQTMSLEIYFICCFKITIVTNKIKLLDSDINFDALDIEYLPSLGKYGENLLLTFIKNRAEKMFTKSKEIKHMKKLSILFNDKFEYVGDLFQGELHIQMAKNKDGIFMEIYDGQGYGHGLYYDYKSKHTTNIYMMSIQVMIF